MPLVSEKSKISDDNFGGHPVEDDNFGGHPVDLLKEFNKVGAKSATPQFFRDALNGTLGAVDELTLHNLQYSPKFKSGLQDAEEESPNSMTAGRGVGLAGLAGAGFILPGGPILQSVAQGALTKPANDGLSPEQDFTKRGIQAGASGVLGLGMNSFLKSGLQGGGDWAMQNAVGIRKAIPGMGNRIADEGLFGTKSMMRKQAENKINAHEQNLTDAVANLTGQITPSGPARALRNKTLPFIPEPGGSGPLPVPSENAPFVDNGMSRVSEAIARGDMTPTEALSMSRAIAKPAYNKTGAPLDAFKWRLGQSEAAALKDAIKAKADSQGMPQASSSLASEQALINARNGLDRQQTIEDSLISHGKRGLVGGLAAMSVGHGLPGMVVGGVAADVAASPLFMSGLGQFGTRGAKSIPYLTPAAVDALVRKAMVDKQ